MFRCPGCGGRNEPDARVCEWCGRPFVDEGRQITAPWLLPLAIAGIALLALAAILVGILGPRLSVAGTTEQTIAAGLPASSAEPFPRVEEPPPPESEAPRSEFVRVANTGNVGAFIRREPNLRSPGLIAHRDGTVLRVVGPDLTLDGQVWRPVEDQGGNRGWTPREFLAASDTGF